MDSDTKTWNRLYALLAQDDWDQTVYIFRVDRSGRTVKPFLAKWAMHSNLIERIRDDFGAGEYHLMIRQGETILFTEPLALDLGPGNRGRRLNRVKR